MDPLLAGLQGGDEDVTFPATIPSREIIAFDNLVAPLIPSLHFERALIIAKKQKNRLRAKAPCNHRRHPFTPNRQRTNEGCQIMDILRRPSDHHFLPDLTRRLHDAPKLTPRARHRR